jgi:hypothetical protein
MRSRTVLGDYLRQSWLFYRTRRLTSVDLQRLNKALAILEATTLPEYEVDVEEPIFILSAGWRSGSTIRTYVFSSQAY